MEIIKQEKTQKFVEILVSFNWNRLKEVKEQYVRLGIIWIVCFLLKVYNQILWKLQGFRSSWILGLENFEYHKDFKNVYPKKGQFENTDKK